MKASLPSKANKLTQTLNPRFEPLTKTNNSKHKIKRTNNSQLRLRHLFIKQILATFVDFHNSMMESFAVYLLDEISEAGRPRELLWFSLSAVFFFFSRISGRILSGNLAFCMLLSVANEGAGARRFSDGSKASNICLTRSMQFLTQVSHAVQQTKLA